MSFNLLEDWLNDGVKGFVAHHERRHARRERERREEQQPRFHLDDRPALPETGQRVLFLSERPPRHAAEIDGRDWRGGLGGAVRGVQAGVCGDGDFLFHSPRRYKTEWIRQNKCPFSDYSPQIFLSHYMVFLDRICDVFLL